MKESSFVGVFEAIAKEILGDAAVHRKANLFYELFLDRKLELAVRDTRHPKRGSSAFQTDICICEMLDGVQFPRVVIEFKEGITTHDILTYSAKAGRHKQIYPCLRYGLLSSATDSIPSRFFYPQRASGFLHCRSELQNSRDASAFRQETFGGGVGDFSDIGGDSFWQPEV